MSWHSYQSADTINRWLECLADNFPSKVQLTDIGRSYEGRPLKVIRVGDGARNKPAVFIDGGIHAR